MAATTTASVSSEAVLRVVFVDGDREFNLGPFPFVPSLGLSAFKARISEQIGVTPRQISLSVVRRSVPPAPDVPRTIAINERTDFHAIARERDCVVLASLCRARSGRRGKRRSRSRGFISLVEGGTHGESPASAPATRIQRRPGGSAHWSNHDPANDEMAAQALAWQYEREKQARLRHMASRFVAEYYAPAPPRSLAPAAACGECDAAASEGRTPEFHCCVRDPIVVGFGRRVPPIERPRSSGAAAVVVPTANPIL